MDILKNGRRRAAIATAMAGLAGLIPAAGSAQMGFAAHYPYQTGQDIYTHICQGCHMPDAKGAVGAGMYPALTGNKKLQAGLYPVMVVVRGQKAMPSFGDLSDDQVAAVVNYIRTSFGNRYADTITSVQVAAMRPKPKP